MNDALQFEEIKLYEYNQYKSELEDECIRHFNPNHDPSNGQFTTGPGGIARSIISKFKTGSVNRKRRKALKKARIARAQKAKIKTFDKQMKEDIIKKKDIKSMFANVDKFSNQEINDMLTRLDTERRLKEKVREYENAHKSTGQKIAEGIKTSAKEGAIKGGKQLIKTASANSIKWAGKKVLTELGGKDTKIGDERWGDIVNKLLKEEKK